MHIYANKQMEYIQNVQPILCAIPIAITHLRAPQLHARSAHLPPPLAPFGGMIGNRKHE